MTRALLIAGALVFAVACGKKGPPLAPVSHFPGAIAAPSLNRIGDTVYVGVTVPAKNIDGNAPADVARIELYAVTALTPPSPVQMLAAGTRIASVPVAPPPRPGEAPVESDKPAQGATLSVVERLAPDDYKPATLPRPAVRPGTAAPPQTEPPATPASAPDEEPVVQRFYMAMAFNQRGRPGPPGALNSLNLVPAPAPPSHLNVTYTADTVTFTFDPVSGPEAAFLAYNVYPSVALDPLDLPPAPPPFWSIRPPARGNAIPLTVGAFTRPTEFGRTVCFAVTTTHTVPPVVEGNFSEPACVTPVDTFPPAAPKSLSAVAAEGAISLIWEPNTDPDLDGYIVLRGDAGSATLQPLTVMPVAEPQFTDRTVRSGVRYVYAVVAVDNRLPVPNVSAESNRVEETAR